MTVKTLKIGTRGSPLALRQTALVEEALTAIHPWLATERVIMRTSGDWKPEDGEKRLSEAEGGKGLFAREIERALAKGEIDCAVHSLKDMPSFLPQGLALDHVLERGDPRDAFICSTASAMDELPLGAIIGTSSLRRQSFVLMKRADLKVVPFRGNVQTRLSKLEEGQVDATFLALVGLQRLDLHESFVHPVSISDMLPSCGQGTIAIETRIGDDDVRLLMDGIHHVKTGICSFIERAALQALDGSCHTPIGAYARFEGEKILFDLVVASGDGKRVYRDSAQGMIDDKVSAEQFGHELGAKLKAVVPTDIFS
jgi:hydroxymethylbilane synthase